MKKFLCILAIIGIITLSSCSKKAAREVIIDNPADEVAEALALNDVKNGTSLNPDLDKKGAYADVKISNEVKNSLFYQTVDLDSYLEEKNRLKDIYINEIAFSNRIPYSDVQEFFKVMNHEEYGLTEEKLGVEFKEEEGISTSLVKDHKLSHQIATNVPDGYEKKDGDASKLVVIYLPVYCVYDDGTQPYTNIFIMVPVYFAYAYESTVANYTYGIKNYQCDSVNEHDGLFFPSK